MTGAGPAFGAKFANNSKKDLTKPVLWYILSLLSMKRKGSSIK